LAVSDLEHALFDRLERLPLPGPEADLLVGAILGEDDLTEAIGGTPPARPEPAAGDLATGDRVPAGAYLKSITIAGFRGVGPATTLSLQAGPGLTIVCGRNGSGKSSFAEGLEVLLTGQIRRFADRSAVWKESWRCLHGVTAQVSAELVIEGVKGSTKVSRTWAAGDAQVTDGSTRVRIPGEPDAGLERLGWGDALLTYRPLLSHTEMEVILARPADLFDQLNGLLGLGELADIIRLLADARKRSEAVVKAAKDNLTGLVTDVTGLADERAATAKTLLAARKVDLDALEALAAGVSASDEGEMATLSRLSALRAPARPDVERVSAELVGAADRLEEVGSTAAGDAAATAELLTAAVSHFERHGPGDCPVCGRSEALDAGWAQEATDRARRFQDLAADLQTAAAAARAALQAADLLLAPCPDVIADADRVGVDADAVSEAWVAWAAAPPKGATPSELRATVAHFQKFFPSLANATAAMTAAATSRLQGRQDLWAPVASRLAAWCAAERRARGAKDTVDRLKRVEKWVKDANDGLRNERLRPFVDGTTALWAQLRQESNIDLVGMTLTGAATRRAVDFEVTVDGSSASGLGVMSQGEVNALALSVFLPRATSGASPLRFVVIDDPVQAMDPSKVDGLARVFADAARTRQVIVFTHDERLPAAIRQLGLDARILQVTRRADSVVQIHAAGDPAEQHLRDAGALAIGDDVPAEVAGRVVPGLCRAAIESVCIEITRNRRLAQGASQEAVEAALAAAHRLLPRLALAVLDDAERGGDVYNWLNAHIGTWATDTVKACNRGSHTATAGTGPLVGETRRLVERLRQKAP
jgi:recombinational DNA repair ATPase RecF